MPFTYQSIASKEMPKSEVSKTAEETSYEQRLASALRESRADFEEGRYYEGVDAMMEALVHQRAAR